MAQTVVVLKRAHFFGIAKAIIDGHALSLGARGVAIDAVLARLANCTTGEGGPALARLRRARALGRSAVKRYRHRPISKAPHNRAVCEPHPSRIPGGQGRADTNHDRLSTAPERAASRTPPVASASDNRQTLP
jgi:hypothetical protein